MEKFSKMLFPNKPKSAEQQEIWQAFIAEIKKAGLEIAPGREFDIPEINYEYFGNERDRQAAEKYISGMTEFLRTPYLYDKFGPDHEARHKWRDNIYQEFGSEFYYLIAHSKLSLNEMNVAQSYLRFLIKLCEKSVESQPLAQDLEKIWQGDWQDKVWKENIEKDNVKARQQRVEILEDIIFQALQKISQITNK